MIGSIRVVHQFVDMPKESATYFNTTTGELQEVRKIFLRKIPNL